MPFTFRKFLCLLWLALATFFLAHAGERNRDFVLVIDAGHGGKDAGAVGAYSKEKNINLKVALAFGKLVEQNCPDVKVVYTRKTDVFIPLQRRADIANEKKADLFVSIHTNALAKGRIAYGSETYSLGMARAQENLEVAKRENGVITYEADYKSVYEGFDPNKPESYVIFEFMQDKYMKQSVDLASCIQRQYKKAGRADKGVHQAGFLVLRNTMMPAVLTELGFITTPEEEAYLNSARGVEELSSSIYNGFLAYRRQYDKQAEKLPADLQVAAADKAPAEPNAVAAEAKAEVVPVQVVTQENVERAPSETEKDSSRPSELAAKPKQPVQEKKAARPDTNRTPTKTAGEKSVKKSNAKKTSGVEFRIQLSAGKKALATNDRVFAGLKVQRVREGNFYKYHYGSFKTYAEARKAQTNIKDKFPDAYIVAYKDRTPLPLSEARKIAAK